MFFETKQAEYKFVAKFMAETGCNPYDPQQCTYFADNNMDRTDIQLLGRDMIAMALYFKQHEPELYEEYGEDGEYLVLGHDINGIRNSDSSMLPKCSGYRKSEFINPVDIDKIVHA